MSNKMNNSDYKNILDYYKIPIPKSKILLKQIAEKILAEKLCKCIKQVDSRNEAKSIGICTKNIFNKKGLTRGTFKCKKNKMVTFRKTSTFKKTRKNLKK